MRGVVIGILLGSLGAAWAGPVVGGVVALQDAKERAAPSGKASVQQLARGEAAFLGRLTLQPGAVVPEHRDPTEEYIHVISGGGTMTIDGVTWTVGPGDTVFMPAHALVTYTNGDAPTVVLQVFAGPGPSDKYDAWVPVRP